MSPTTRPPSKQIMMQLQHAAPLTVVNSTVPDVALEWILNWSCSSNTYLATMSNVCRQWRNIILEYLKGHFDAALEGPRTMTRNPLKGLLLPDMALEIAKRRLTGMKCSSLLLQQESDAFCLAWFHPRGIKVRTVDVAENFEESSSSSSEGDKDEMLSYKFHLKKASRKLKKRGKMSLEFKTVAEEWQGYRNATDVLFPFGYATAFVREFLQHAAEYKLKTSDVLLAPLLPPMKASNNLLQIEKITKSRTTTFAVRGATFARPHGFCLCWADNAKDSNNIHAHEDMDNLDATNDNYRTQMYKLKSMKKRDKKRRIRMRDSLPRTCLSTLAKNPVYQGQFGHLGGRRQRSIQFLNSDKNRAVYMRTHPFDCGPIQAPVTMFVVAIATEDGCFVSGLKRRFELGHLYGDGSVDSMMEMSPVCLATESSKPQAIRGSGGYQDIDSDDSSMFGVRRVAENGDANCNCKIQWKQKYERGGSSDEDDGSPYHSEVDEQQIVRGALGPGRWHVYTATFYGEKSVIRIDGVDEPLRGGEGTDASDMPILDGLTIGSDHLFDMSLCFGEGSEGEGAGSITELAVFKGAMDKQDILKIEDHLMRKHGILHGSTGFVNNDLSSVAKSSDAIKGLSEKDELRTRAHDQWQADKWKRDVHSLMMHAPPCLPPSGSGIPLRIVTRHRSVAWYRCCEVTGKPLRVSRIGSKQSNGSSDW